MGSGSGPGALDTTLASGADTLRVDAIAAGGIRGTLGAMNEPSLETTNLKTDTDAGPGSTSDATDRAKILARLRRMEGQVRGVHKMVEEDQYCLDILTQISAITAAARSVGLLVLEDHVRSCVMGTCRHGRHDEEDLLGELSGAIERFTRSVG